MESARIANPPSSQGTATARAKSSGGAKSDGLQPAPQGADFLALLGFLSEELVSPPEPLPEASSLSSETTAASAGALQGAMPWPLPDGLFPWDTATWSSAPLEGESPSHSGVLAAGGGGRSLAAPETSMVSPALSTGRIALSGEGPLSNANADGGALMASATGGQGVPWAATDLSLDRSTAIDGLVAQTQRLDAAAVAPQGGEGRRGGMSQFTLERVQDSGVVAFGRGRSGPAVTGKTARPDVGQGPLSVSALVVNTQVSERTVDLGSWALRDHSFLTSRRSEAQEGTGLTPPLTEQDTQEAFPVLRAGQSDGGALSGGFPGGAGPEGVSLPEAGRSPGEATETFGLTAEDQVADQVAQWVGQTVHNAEMTLDREGQAVHVTVSLSGQEAHVHFRTAEGQTRALLDAHLSDLRDMLRDQGLELAGAWVGTDPQQGGGQDPSSSGRQTVDWLGRSALQSAPESERGLSTPPLPRPRPSPLGGARLDVFA